MKRGLIKGITTVLTVSLATGLMIGCGEKKESSEAGTDLKKPITMQLAYWETEAPDGKSKLFQEVQEKTGVTLDVTWVPAASAAEKTTSTIAGGNVPEVTMIQRPDMRAKIVQDAIDGGMFWDLTPYLEDYPNLNSIPDDIKTGLSYDGKIYGLPRMVMLRGGGLVYREDWASKLGIEEPQTLDDFYNMFDKFTKNDPDGNGKDDTTGLVIFNGVFIRPLMLAAGCPMDWWVDEKDNNTVKPLYLSENFLPYLDFMKKLYDNGLINKDFAGTKLPQAKSKVNQGTGGAIPTNIGNIMGTEYKALTDSNKDAKLRSITAVKQSDGTLVAEESTGFSSIYCISKKAAPTEERLRQILQFFNDTMNPEIVDLFLKGDKDVHYKETDGKFEWVDHNAFVKDSAGLASVYVTPILAENLKLGTIENAKEYYDFQTDSNIKGYPNIVSWFKPNTDASGVAGIVESAASKYVMGEATKDEVLKTVDKWLSGGGQKQIDDWTEQYAKIKSNK